MAYNVVAIVHDRIGVGKIGNTEACKIVVSVSDSTGAGVGSLTTADFKVSQPAANLTVTFAGPDPSGLAGFYVIDVKPGVQWHKGQYHFCIQVVHGKKPVERGQTVALLELY